MAWLDHDGQHVAADTWVKCVEPVEFDPRLMQNVVTAFKLSLIAPISGVLRLLTGRSASDVRVVML